MGTYELEHWMYIGHRGINNISCQSDFHERSQFFDRSTCSKRSKESLCSSSSSSLSGSSSPIHSIFIVFRHVSKNKSQQVLELYQITSYYFNSFKTSLDMFVESDH